jgi:KDO2-lipid IV(A) lauroyltransferase
MESLLYYLALAVIKGLQALPLRWVARLGRRGGGLVYWFDARHRRVALENLTMCFGTEKTPAEIRALARENFRRLGESYACAVKTASMTAEQLRLHLEFVGVENFYPQPFSGAAPRRIVAIGHFGNFELYARLGQYLPGVKPATTYRALSPPALDRLLQSLRSHADCLYFERRADAASLKAAMNLPGIILGFLVDQHAGASGVRTLFFGKECSTSAAPAIFALRYDCPLHTAICFRTGLAQWRIEAGPEIPTREKDKPRALKAIMLDVNRTFEKAIRRDPANWFWVHRRWKAPRHQAQKSSAPVSHPGSEQPSQAGSQGVGVE